MHLKVRKRTGQKGWMLRVWEKGKERYVPQIKYPAGLRSDMSIEKARSYIKALNATLRPPVQISRLKAIKRLRHRITRNHPYLPKKAVLQYEKNCILFLKEDEPARLKREQVWTAAQDLLCSLNISPCDWATSLDVVYAYLEKKKYSWDYCKRIVRAMNHYGNIYCRMIEKYFQPLKLADRKKRAVIESGFVNGQESDPLRAEALKSLQNNIPPNKFSWLWISFWFGLRPQEVDMLRSRTWKDAMPTWWIEDDESTLVVYQPKLWMLNPKRRYRRIPLYFAEQYTALKMIKEGAFQRPTNYEVERWLPENVSLYGCRHGFACHMDSKGIDIYAISRWLGHQSVRTTERYYVRLAMRRNAITGISLKRASYTFNFISFLNTLFAAVRRIFAATFL